jgi:hypothetical protein
MKALTRIVKSAAVAGVVLIAQCAVHGQDVHVRGPSFEAWDFRFGQIESETTEWMLDALNTGSLGHRELSCKVIRQQTILVFPLHGEFPRYGFTFEYKTSRPGMPVVVRWAYGDRLDGPLTHQSTEQRFLRANKGRFCFSQFDVTGSVEPGRYCYEAMVEGQRVKEWCVTLTNQ